MMTSICYFSGTGNSLAVAKELQKRLDAQLVSIASVVDQDSISIDASTIGMVFPVYNHLIPFIIKRFVERLSDVGSKYVFAVCTYANSPCIALRYLDGLIRAGGGHLSAGFAIQMPYNYILPSPTFRNPNIMKSFVLKETTADEQERMFAACRRKIDLVCEYVLSRRSGMIETKHEAIERVVDLFDLRETLQKPFWLRIAGYTGKTVLPYMETIQLMDHGFHSDGNCTRCSTCVKICPVGNIKMTGSGPEWQHRCEQCFACLHWCPQEAVQFRNASAGRRRYHHPSISLSEMELSAARHDS